MNYKKYYQILETYCHIDFNNLNPVLEGIFPTNPYLEIIDLISYHRKVRKALAKCTIQSQVVLLHHFEPKRRRFKSKYGKYDNIVLYVTDYKYDYVNELEDKKEIKAIKLQCTKAVHSAIQEFTDCYKEMK